MSTSFEEYYNEFGGLYFEKRSKDGMLFNEMIEIPAVLKIVSHYSLEPDAKILDIGCAFGFYARYFASKGFFVTAIDISEEMISIAKEYCIPYENIKFIKTDFNHAQLDNSSYDFILGSFMLGYFNDLSMLFTKVNSLMKRNSIAIFSMLHPIVQCKIEKKEQGYLINNYFSEGYFQSDFLSKEKLISLKKWSIADISEACKNCGLYMDSVIEPKPILNASIDRSLNDFYNNNPSVMIFVLKQL